MASPLSQPTLPVVGPHPGETEWNDNRRRGVFRNVQIGQGPGSFHGFVNEGSYQCYMIAIIQGLLHHPRVAQYCRYHHIGPRSAEPDNARLIQHGLQDDKGKWVITCGYCQIYELLVRYWTKHFDSEEDRGTAINSRLQKLLTRYLESMEQDSELSRREQQDSAAAYRALLAWFDKGFDMSAGISTTEATNALFRMNLQKIDECQVCSHRTEGREEIEATLMIDFGDYSSVRKTLVMKDSLERVLTTTLTKRCERCPGSAKRSGEAHTSKRAFTYFPELLAIYLGIIDAFRQVKRKDELRIVEYLDMSAYSNPPAPTGTVNYRLSAVIKHIGADIRGGHYICYARAPNTSTWFCCDDTTCNASTFNEATAFRKDITPYVLFYERLHPQDTRNPDEHHEAKEYELSPWWQEKLSKKDTSKVNPEQGAESAELEPQASAQGKSPAKKSPKQPQNVQAVAIEPAHESPQEDIVKDAIATQNTDDLANADDVAAPLAPSRPKKKLRKSPQTKDRNYVPSRDTESEADDHILTPDVITPISAQPEEKEPEQVKKSAKKTAKKPTAAVTETAKPSPNYASNTIPVLKEILKERGITFTYRERKAELIEKLIAYDAENKAGTVKAAQATEPADVEPAAEAVPEKKKPGRPKGAKNKKRTVDDVEPEPEVEPRAKRPRRERKK